VDESSRGVGPARARYGAGGDDRSACASTAVRCAGVAQHGRDALKLLPREADTKARWSVSEWAAQRKGWVFITSRPTVRERLRPLISLIIDQLILHCMTAGGMDTPKTWFALDEVASSSLQRLPQLETALMENRKANCPPTSWLPGQGADRGAVWARVEAMLSQPMTKVFFKTSEANAADWISRTIGEVELERYRESRSHGQSAQGMTPRASSARSCANRWLWRAKSRDLSRCTATSSTATMWCVCAQLT